MFTPAFPPLVSITKVFVAWVLKWAMVGVLWRRAGLQGPSQRRRAAFTHGA